MRMREVTRQADLEEKIRDLAKRAKLNCWTEFVRELKVPSELVPALTTGRPELVCLAKPRELTAEEAAALYKLIGALIETNMVLRGHASEVADMVSNWVGSLHGMIGVADKIGRFADFRHEEAAEPVTSED